MSEDRKVTVIPPTLGKLGKNVGIYCRVSTRSQEQLNSLTNQISYLTRICYSKRIWILADIYVDIKSGADTQSRPEYQRMLDACRAGKLDIVLTKSISRFGRNTEEMLRSIRELKSAGVEVVFEQEEISTADANSDLMISIFEAVAEADNESRRQNILWGINRRLENGTSSMYFRRCYGYINDSDGNPIICPEEATVVQLIFELYLGGMSIVGIISELASRGIKSPTGKDNWCKRSIDTVLSNEKYIGNSLIFKTYSAGYPKTKRVINNDGKHRQFKALASHPPIITKEAFQAAANEKANRTNIETGEYGIKRRKGAKYSSKKKNNSD